MQEKQLCYLECPKTGYHYGEVLNMMCLEQGCLDKALCCSACIEESHKNHQVKPLKLVLREAKDHASKIQPFTINPDKILDLLASGQKAIQDKFNAFKQKLNQHVDGMEKTLNGFYTSSIDQVRIKTNDSKDGILQLFDLVYKNKTMEELLVSMQKVLTLMPKSDASEESIQEDELIQTIAACNTELEISLGKLTEDILTKVQVTSKLVVGITVEKDIWAKQEYRFTQKLKHTDVKILSPTVAVSGTNQTYKFAVLEPQIKKTSGVEKLAFKIKETSSNWLAFGVCHKNIVASKNFSFAFNSVGHGAYLISSNGGSWSHTNPSYNNLVKTFKFNKGDIVTIEINYDTSRILFRKKGGSDVYELQFSNTSGDPLHPCVLLYYPNDEVYFLPKYKD